MSFLNRWGKSLALLCALALGCTQTQAEDIDIFIGNSTVDTGLPNVVFVLDNTSNWARQNQQWPGGLTQGQSEVRAIKQALVGLEGKVNVGVVEFTTAGNANQDGGFVRFRLQQLTESDPSGVNTVDKLNTVLTTIENDINGSLEKRNSNTPYGNLMYDVYNYLAGGAQSYNGDGTDDVRADNSAYSSTYSQFLSPLSSDSACGKTYLIFIGNPNASGPTDDSLTNSAALRALYSGLEITAPDGLAQSTNPAPLPMPKFSTTVEGGTALGYSKSCYVTAEDAVSDSINQCSLDEAKKNGLCEGKELCSCASKPVLQDKCKAGQARLSVVEGAAVKIEAIDGAFDTVSGRAWNMDDWSKFLNQQGVPVTVELEGGEDYIQRVPVITYSIDVFNKQPNEQHSALMFSAAKAGGGRYFQAKSESAIVDAINTALSDILSVSSTFAAVTLPLSATNRAQSKNQVYIGMFRPDQAAKPRWFGNLKRYQVGIFDGEPGLADAQAKQAVNPLSGFAAECAESFWTSNSGTYWQSLGITPPPLSQCLGSLYSEWSDLPDGPFVEKGGSAQVSRKSDLSGRALLTVNGTALGSMTNAAAVGGDAVLSYLKGASVGVGEVAAGAGGRPSIHGDVVHSRPLTINYGDTIGTYIYYGSNDGLYRSIRANTGAERWSLIAPEHYGKIKRLYDNSPIVDFPNQTDAAAKPKDYFFDGSTGHVISYNESDEISLAYIFPTMRRGGRMIYGLKVTDPASPSLMWRLGCPSLTSDAGCSSGFSELGQTWSTPVSALLPGYSDSAAVLIFGGGYDNCLDVDQTAYACDNTAKGRGVYVLDAQAGTLLAGPSQLPTDGPIVGDVSLVDFNQDGKPDFAYVADAKGGLYRVNFASVIDGVLVARLPNAWTIDKVAAMSGNTRRFFNTPTVLALENAVYVALGSGNRERPLESNYPYQNDIDDRFYVFVDFPAATSATTVDLDGSALLNVTPGPGTACDARGARGWYTSLLGRGEQVVNPAAIAGGKVFFNTYRPGGASVGMCSRPLGVAAGCAIDLFNPSACDLERCSEIAGGGMPIAPVITTVCVGCNAGRPDPDSVNGELIYDDPDHVDGSIVATVNNPDGSTGTKDVTICIGCKGLEPLPIEAAPPASRIRTYWNSDIDR